jgi:hypothetical protein
MNGLAKGIKADRGTEVTEVSEWKREQMENSVTRIPRWGKTSLYTEADFSGKAQQQLA